MGNFWQNIYCIAGGIPRSMKGTNVALLQICFVDYGLSHAGIFEHMLADLSVHLEYVVGGLGFRIWAALRRHAIALSVRCFGHCEALIPRFNPLEISLGFKQNFRFNIRR